MKLRAWLGLASVIILAGGIGYQWLWPKIVSLRYRIQLIGARQQSLAAPMAYALASHQASRGDALIPVRGPSPLANGAWQSIGGNWSEFKKTKALGVYKDNLYVGFAKGPRAEIWRYDGGDWQRVGIWTHLNDVTALIVYEGALIAAMNNEVWSYDGTTWRNLNILPVARVYSLASNNGTLFVGTSMPVPSRFCVRRIMARNFRGASHNREDGCL
jgi:hypothetical protein